MAKPRKTTDEDTQDAVTVDFEPGTDTSNDGVAPVSWNIGTVNVDMGYNEEEPEDSAEDITKYEEIGEDGPKLPKGMRTQEETEEDFADNNETFLDDKSEERDWPSDYE